MLPGWMTLGVVSNWEGEGEGEGDERGADFGGVVSEFQFLS
jgi:hypothetical protein